MLCEFCKGELGYSNPYIDLRVIHYKEIVVNICIGSAFFILLVT